MGSSTTNGDYPSYQIDGSSFPSGEQQQQSTVLYPQFNHHPASYTMHHNGYNPASSSSSSAPPTYLNTFYTSSQTPPSQTSSNNSYQAGYNHLICEPTSSYSSQHHGQSSSLLGYQLSAVASEYPSSTYASATGATVSNDPNSFLEHNYNYLSSIQLAAVTAAAANQQPLNKIMNI